jgi:uncharacterized protein YecE (DUF72 family)
MNQLYLGTQGWSYKSWVGNLYPAGTTPDKYLIEYVKHFGAIEVDSTYYAIPRPQTAQNWRAVTPDDFRFTAKFPQVITHEKMLKDAQSETLQFLDVMRLLGDKLGPLLLQFPYQFKPDQKETLARFLEALPRDLRFAIEVRHRGWLDEDFFRLLETHRIAFVLADLAYMPRVIRATTDFTYIRWLGNRKDIPDGEYERVRINRDKELARWTEIIREMNEKGVAVWGFANNHYQGHSPATIRALMERLAQ